MINIRRHLRMKLAGLGVKQCDLSLDKQRIIGRIDRGQTRHVYPTMQTLYLFHKLFGFDFAEMIAVVEQDLVGAGIEITKEEIEQKRREANGYQQRRRTYNAFGPGDWLRDKDGNKLKQLMSFPVPRYIRDRYPKGTSIWS